MMYFSFGLLADRGIKKDHPYMYMYDWAPSLFIWNYHNIADRLYPSKKYEVFLKNKRFSWPLYFI